jgi:glycerophosphoryl diester phosphodiesterase
MLVIAHRGNNKEAFENSFSAYDLSVACKADRIELDVVLSRDGQAVINHDDYLLHTTGHDLYCSEMDRRELETLKLKNGESIPFLDQVVERYLHRIELNIEIKGNNPKSAQAVAQIIRNHHLRERIIVSSFCPDPLIYMRNHCPDIRRACLTGDDSFPWPFFSHAAVLNFMQMTSSGIIHPRADLVSTSFMDQCLHRRWQVFTWSPMIGEDVGREFWWTLLKTRGVHGHCTNYPREFMSWLKQEDVINQRMQRMTINQTLVGDLNAH